MFLTARIHRAPPAILIIELIWCVQWASIRNIRFAVRSPHFSRVRRQNHRRDDTAGIAMFFRFSSEPIEML
jgi:hypothetical protein